MKRYSIAKMYLIGMSLVFYAYFNVSYLLIILASVFFNFTFYKIITNNENSSIRKSILATALFFNISLLAYYKYTNFLITNINDIFKSNIPFFKIILPLGISFFTFQQISFIVDSYNKETPKYSFVDYAAFVTFFPQLIAGPIVLHTEVIPQINDEKKKSINWQNLSEGIFLFVLGLSKKVILADNLGNAVNWGYSMVERLDSTNAIIIMLSYTFQIYFDFSGYCDMAKGIGKLFNIDLPINFNSPYKARSISEFWKRWHITLTRFLTKYIYFPLGGNRKGRIRTYINILIVFLVSGLWHGANWTFIVWGILHGIMQIIDRALNSVTKRIPGIFRWFGTFLFINVTWIFFRADSISDALLFIKKVLSFRFGRVDDVLYESFYVTEFQVINKLIPISKIIPHFSLYTLLLLSLFYSVIAKKNAIEQVQDFKPNIKTIIVISGLFLWCILSFSGVSTFLYFNF